MICLKANNSDMLAQVNMYIFSQLANISTIVGLVSYYRIL